MSIIFETSLKSEEEQLIEDYYNVKRNLSELLKREELLKNKIKELMNFYNIKSINTNKIDLILNKLEKIYYLKRDIENNVSIEILNKIKKIQKIEILVSKIKNGND